MKPKFKVGDVVRTKKDLSVGDVCGDITLQDFMVTDFQMVTRLKKEGNNNYCYLDNNYIYREEMLEYVVLEASEGKISTPHREFVTGALRDTHEGKSRTGLLPWHLFPRLAKHYELGATKYGDGNWLLGQPKDTTFDSLTRHLIAYRCGETDEDHLSAIIWNAFSMMHVDETYGNNPDLQTFVPLKGTWAEIFDFLKEREGH